MATDSTVVTKSYAETIAASSLTYSAATRKVYAETLTPYGYFPYQAGGLKVYAEIIGDAQLLGRRRLVTALVVQARS
ncbi:hypothetical protein AWB81_04201 [Caballeronia arationis]|uniref:hypothetical protein n=1 Tax=Caballeronia arationis TaxID=1777142 RepID=UPI00074CA12C|nr:hypothetical protein [Caballeronia arationis]SAK83361.1 hypothetical protein AWB81_04201 [Caballeronia arationis]